jgi:hypothetical protein
MQYTSSNQPPKSSNLPPGEYPVTIVAASTGVSRAGADMIKLTLNAEGPNGENAKFFDHLVADPACAWKNDAFRQALGHEVVPGETVELIADELVGQTLRARLKVDEFNGRKTNKVAAWLAPVVDRGPSPSAAVATNDKKDPKKDPF